MTSESLPKNRKAVIEAWQKCSVDVQKYFKHLPMLIENKESKEATFPIEVCLSYMFFLLERAQNMALYGGVIKLHKVDADLAYIALSEFYKKRKEFPIFYKTIFGFELPKGPQTDMEKAEEVRDKVMHGKDIDEENMRKAIIIVLNYAEAINSQLSKWFKPFGKLRGKFGGQKRLDKTKSRFILKGIGFLID